MKIHRHAREVYRRFGPSAIATPGCVDSQRPCRPRPEPGRSRSPTGNGLTSRSSAAAPPRRAAPAPPGPAAAAPATPGPRPPAARNLAPLEPAQSLFGTPPRKRDAADQLPGDVLDAFAPFLAVI